MGTAVVILILAVIIGLAIRKMIADHKAGKSCCGCSGGACGCCSNTAKSK